VTTILLDVDGVCGGFVEALLQQIQANVSFEDIDRWEIFEQLSGVDERCARLVLDTAAFWRSTIQPYLEAQIAITNWRAHGHEIVFVTSPWLTCKTWDHDRRAWLAQHFLPADVITTRAKHHVTGDVFVDDRESNVTRWQQAHPLGLALLMCQPHNRRAVRRRYSWPEIVEIVASHVPITQRRT